MENLPSPSNLIQYHKAVKTAVPTPDMEQYQFYSMTLGEVLGIEEPQISYSNIVTLTSLNFYNNQIT